MRFAHLPQVPLLLRWLSAVLSALLGAYFITEATYNPNRENYSYHWNAHWIQSPFKSRNACFRKRFVLTQLCSSAYVVVSGDNFFRVKVNGSELKPFFMPGKYSTWMAEQSIYTAIGYARHEDRGIVYEISGKLRLGKNVITAEVQSDSGAPKICIQGETFGSQHHLLATDASWTVSPLSDSIEGIPWESPYYDDIDWKPVVDLNYSKQLWIDGELSCLSREPTGSFVHAPHPDTEMRFSKSITVSSDIQDGWLRIQSGLPYDLRIDGRLVYSTALLDRYDTLPWSKRGNTDAFTRVASGSDSSQYPQPVESRKIDLFILKNALLRGSNQLEVTLHAHPIPEMREAPSLWVDGAIQEAHSTINFATGPDWRVSSANGTQSDSPVQESPASFKTLIFGSLHLTRTVDSGINFPVRVAAWSVPLLAVALGFVVLGSRTKSSFLSAALHLAPTVGVLVTAYLLQLIYENSNERAYFDSFRFAWLIVVLTLAAQCVWVVSAGIDKISPARTKIVRKRRFLGVAALSVLMLAAATLYAHGIQNNSLLADEYVSVLASSGIVRHGYPVYENTGITYTRSSLYSYLLAGALWLSPKGSYLLARLISSAFQLGSTLLSFTWAKKIRGVAAGLLAAFLTAFSPMGVFFAREVRFYAQFEFFLTLTGFLCWLSVMHPHQQRYRVGTMLAFSCAYLSQQFALVILPAIFVAAWYPGQLRAWLRGSSLVGVLFAIFVMGADGYLFFKFCLTQFPYIDDESVSLFAVHNDILEVLPSTLLTGYERTGLIEGVAFMGGLVALSIAWIKRPARSGDEPKKLRPIPFLYLYSLTGFALTALLASRPTTRYIIHMLPCVSIVAACLLTQLGQSLVACVRTRVGALSSAVTCVSYTGCVLLLVLAAYRPLRTWNATYRSSNRDITGAMRFLKARASSSDYVVVLNPEAAMVELGKCDFLWRPKRGSIFKYVANDGEVRERNSSATVIDDLPKLKSLMAQGHRVWIVAQNANLDSSGTDTAGELAEYIKVNYNYVAQPLGLAVMMWDPGSGHLRNTGNVFGQDTNDASQPAQEDVGDSAQAI